METLKSIQPACFYIGSVYLGTLIFSAPVQAAAFSHVSSNLQISFSQAPESNGLFTNTFTDALAIGDTGLVNGEPAGTGTVADGGNGFVVSQASAQIEAAQSPTDEPPGFLDVSVNNLASGNGEFFGSGSSEAIASGNFLIKANQIFSFDFSGWLKLETEITDASHESALAGGSIFLNVGDDSFDILSFLNSPGDDLGPEIFSAENFNFSTLDIIQEADGLSELTYISFSGSYSEQATEDRDISLSAELTSEVLVDSKVTVPAPSLLWGLLTLGGIGLAKKISKFGLGAYA